MLRTRLINQSLHVPTRSISTIPFSPNIALGMVVPDNELDRLTKISELNVTSKIVEENPLIKSNIEYR